MSSVDQTPMNCPACGREQMFAMWGSVNASLNPELKEGLLSGELMQFQCEACEEEARVVYPLLYHDMGQKLMIWLQPGDTPPDDGPGIGRMQKAFEGYRYRWVQTYNELCEKIRLDDEGIDDRMFEYFKAILCEDEHSPISRADQLLFCGCEEDEGDKCIRFGILSPDSYEEFLVSYSHYAALLDNTTLDLDEVFPLEGQWQRITYRDFWDGEG